MKQRKVLLASLLAASAFAAQSAHAVNWVGTADYTAAASSLGDEDIVGLFDTYDEGVGVVLLKTTSVDANTTTLDGYYQSFITAHTYNGSPVTANNLDQTYELTVVATFTESVNNATGDINVNSGGSFSVYMDTTKDRDFGADTGFTDGDLILWGNIIGGIGDSINLGSQIFGVTNIDIEVTGYDTDVYSPDTIAAGGGIFTLRLGSPYDQSLLSQVTGGAGTVLGQNVAGTGNYLFAADGYTALAVPEAETYAMMLAGLGLVGFMARRRISATV